MNGHRDESSDELWIALKSAEPARSLIAVVENWKGNGCTKDAAERRLSAFLDEVLAHGEPDEDDPVRDVLDVVVGWCIPGAKLFP